MAELTRAIARLMEERTQGPPESTQQRQLLDRLRTTVAPAERARADAFARMLLGRTGADYTVHAGEDIAAAMCASAFRFFAAPGQDPRVRVFAPDFERDGWDSPITAIETAMSDRPFIVDTLRAVLQEAGCTIRVLLHPVLGVERDERGALLAVTPLENAFRRDSMIHAEVEPIADPAAREALANEIREHLGDVLLATDDYQAMRRAASLIAHDLRQSPAATAGEPAPEEIAAFLDWLGQSSFVFLGYREYRLRGEAPDEILAIEPGSGLGLLRKESRSLFAKRPRLRDFSAALQRRIRESPTLLVTKTNAESPIHRRARMDYIGVRDFDAAGNFQRERRFIGLFTSRAYGEEAAAIPVLRRKLESILEAEGAIEDSHDHKSIVSIFNSIPKDHLFAESVDDLRQDIRTILESEHINDVTLTVRPDRLERGVFVAVVVPRDSYSSDLRHRIEELILAATRGTLLDQHVAVEDDNDFARLFFYLAADSERVRALRQEDLRRAVLDLLRTWDDRVRDALDHRGTGTRVLARKYAAVFPPEYRAKVDVQQAARDIVFLEAVASDRQPRAEVVSPPNTKTSFIRLYLPGVDVVLSDFLPVLENLGLRVFDDDPISLTLPEVGAVHLRTFEVERQDGESLDDGASGERLAAALLAHFAGRLTSDRLNSLVLTAGLAWQEVAVLRTYTAHVAQSGSWSFAACTQALARNPPVASAMWAYFRAKFDPHGEVPRVRSAEILPTIETRIGGALDAVEGVADDRLLRAVFATIGATVRTNYFSPREDGAIAVKLESGRIPHLPLPRPLFEIFVYAPHVEGIHLRAGRVARGGLRLTDRPDDYRTEILGLMKTQKAKNAVIVPTGAKGGFLPRGAAAATQAQAVSAYRTFVDALLDLTDNVVRGRIGPPPGILYDEPDPYLVVAADKGTATFSDVANEIATARGFWLGDAFASGGSNGYDHKKIGITARGAWECVRRHFRSLGIDPDRDPISVIGIGDMSGDVFGNGLLLAPTLRLQAAFNHRHIFLDPEPDPARSHAERQRLFELTRSGWDDYDRAALGPGGGVYARAAKRIRLTAEVKSMLGVDADELTGEELIRAILRMPADLLWNGGIGTYVKASTETHADVEDAANDAVRIDASEVQVKVVAEGGNLGFTQLGRIEFAVAGGRINTDAIDNSGGVSLSDHEVNLKIAFGSLIEAGELSLVERNRILAELEGEVTALVLRQNRRQALTLSLEQSHSQRHLIDYLELMQDLDATGLDRALEALPDREALRRRRASFLGLARPELATLLAYAKLRLQHELLESALPDDAYLERLLANYFPRLVADRFRAAVRSHRLRRDIIAVQLANGLVDMVGTTFVTRVCRVTGCRASDVARAWLIAASVGDAETLYLTRLEDAGPPPEAGSDVDSETLALLAKALERAAVWVLQTQDRSEPIGAAVGRLLPTAVELNALLPGVLSADEQRLWQASLAELDAKGLDHETAQRLVRIGYLAEVLEVAHLADDLGVSPPAAADAYYGVGSVIDVAWIRDSLAAYNGTDRWERRAVAGLMEGLMYARRVITRNVLLCRKEGGDTTGCLEQYRSAHAEQLGIIRALIDDIRSGQRPSLPALVVVMREIGRLCSD